MKIITGPALSGKTTKMIEISSRKIFEGQSVLFIQDDMEQKCLDVMQRIFVAVQEMALKEGKIVFVYPNMNIRGSNTLENVFNILVRYGKKYDNIFINGFPISINNMFVLNTICKSLQGKDIYASVQTPNHAGFTQTLVADIGCKGYVAVEEIVNTLQ